MWKGELEFASIRDNELIATVLISQLTLTDTLRVDWNGAPVAELGRNQFHNWLRAGDLGHASGSHPFTVGQIAWIRKGPVLHVTITDIEHVFPVSALDMLHMLAVR